MKWEYNPIWKQNADPDDYGVLWMDDNPFSTPHKRWYFWNILNKKSLNNKSAWHKKKFEKYYQIGIECCDELVELSNNNEQWTKQGFKLTQKFFYYKFMTLLISSIYKIDDLTVYKKLGWKLAYKETCLLFKNKGILKGEKKK